MKPLSTTEALAKAATLCSKSEHCVTDIREKLFQWGFEGDTDKIVETLQKQGFINEVRYARAYINDKYRFAKWGRIKIEQGLRQKQIPSSVFRPIMDEVIDIEEYIQILRDLLHQKRKMLKEQDDYMMKCKLIRYALQRGFTYEEVLCNIDD
jgi:regulatory protein